MQLRTAILSLIPGAAHVDLGRAKRGLLFFFLFAFSANGALIAPYVLGTEGVRTGCALAAAGVWVIALYDATRTAARLRQPPPPHEAAGNAPDVSAERPDSQVQVPRRK